MDIYSPIVRYFVYPLWVTMNSLNRLEYLRDYEKTQYLSKERLKELQWQRLEKILLHAYINCPFYKKRFDENNLKPKDIKNQDDLNKLPILTKKDIQENFQSMISKQYTMDTLIKDKTGGSTGSPLIFFYSKDRLDSREAATLRHNRWCGWNIGDKVACLWGAVQDITSPNRAAKLRNFFIGRSTTLDASSITEDKMFSFAQKLKRANPKIILAYANTMVLFAKFIRDNKISGINPQSVICSAEVLLPEDRAFIESVFGSKVFNRYGCREFSIIASECAVHKGMHINAESLFLEFMIDNRNISTHEIHPILITDLLNYAMPMIRYNIGDMGSPLEEMCSCGRGLPLMNIISGRVTDFIYTPEKTISGIALATYMITNIDGVEQVQLIQETMESLRIKIVRGTYFSTNTIEKLNAKVKQLIGEKMNIKYEFVEQIPREASGKYRFSISNVMPKM